MQDKLDLAKELIQQSRRLLYTTQEIMAVLDSNERILNSLLAGLERAGPVDVPDVEYDWSKFPEWANYAAGQVRIFEEISGTWIQVGSDILGEFSGDQFGYSLSLSADNKIAVAHDGEHLQPLLLLIHRSLAQNILQSVNNGNSSVYKWLMQQPHHVVYFTDTTVFTNVNSLDAL